MNCMKLKQLPGCLDRPRTWQRYLKSRGIYSGSIDGKLEGATAAATQNYQKKTGKRDDDLFCLSFERPDKDHYTEDNTQGPVYLTGPIRDVLRPIAYGYYLLTGKDLVMKSGLRKPETQARLMYEKAKRGSSALGIYNWTLRKPIEDAYEEKTKASAGEQATIDAITAIIQAQMNRHDYISKHLTGRAFDVRNRTMNRCEKEVFEAVVKVVLGSTHGHLIGNEPGGPPHFHVQF